MNERNITIYLYKRYVDDINMVINIPQNIADLELTSCEEEKRTIELIKEIGDSIHSSIEIETFA